MSTLDAFDAVDRAVPASQPGGSTLAAFDAAASARPDKPSPSPYSEMDAQAAMGGTILHAASGLAGAAVGGWRGIGTLLKTGSLKEMVKTIHDTEDALTYNPDAQSDAGQLTAASESKYSPLTWPTQAGHFVGDVINQTGNPYLAPVAAVADVGTQLAIPYGVAKYTKMIPRGGAPEPTAPPAASVPAEAPPTASVSGKPQLADATPELQQAVKDAQASGTPINQQILQRHVDADTLPVPVKLTQGQALQDPELISQEMNGRGKASPSVSPDFYNQQGKALAANVAAMKESVAPDLAKTDPHTLGQTLVDAYKAKDAPIVADIQAKYKALEDANGGQFPIDGQALVANVNSALSKALKSGSVPSDLQSALNEFANGRQMTFEDFETLRSDAADAMRSSADGRARAAAGIIREQLENMPLTPEAAALKPLADQARAAAKARFDALEADPAYKAAVNDGIPEGNPSPLADRFVSGYVTGGRYANVRTMAQNLADNPTAKQALGAATVEFLKDTGKVDAQTGNFTQAGYNKGLATLGPKLDVLVDGKTADVARRVGDTAKLAQTQPRGSYVNNSNTLVGAASELTKTGLSNYAAVKTLGASKVVEKAVGIAKANKAAKQATQPGAGMTNMSDLIKPGQNQ